MNPIVSTAWLEEHLASADLRVVDTRWYLDPQRKGRAEYAAGHIPGAVFMDVDEDLSAPGGAPGASVGRHPWPEIDRVERVMSAAGIGPDISVVAYDDMAGAIASRLWYVLRAHGHHAVAVLDGGLVKWSAEGRRLETATPAIAPRRFQARFSPESLTDKAQLARSSGGHLLLDARAAERFRGDVEPIDPRPGHLPGASNAPFAENLTPGENPVFRPVAELREHYAALGAVTRTPVVYCGSGLTACHDLLALELAGLRGSLYAGSWSEWASDPSLPVEMGPGRPR
jgi:thiosulfate/3-mercaptopyruvate sulfurtransferase